MHHNLEGFMQQIQSEPEDLKKVQKRIIREISFFLQNIFHFFGLQNLISGQFLATEYFTLCLMLNL